MNHSPHTNKLIQKWQQYLQTIEDWKNLVNDTIPKECGCGLVYELPHIATCSDESFAIADMSNLLISEPHYHPELEIYFILQGTGLVVVGNTEHSVQKNSIVVIAPNISHYTVPEKNLVMAVVNMPPFNAQNYVPLLDDNTQAQFSKKQFDSHAKNISHNFLSRISS
jgi:mannose-6-phosphate isomerase-like protein (cupin superfamily)